MAFLSLHLRGYIFFSGREELVQRFGFGRSDITVEESIKGFQLRSD